MTGMNRVNQGMCPFYFLSYMPRQMNQGTVPGLHYLVEITVTLNQPCRV